MRIVGIGLGKRNRGMSLRQGLKRMTPPRNLEFNYKTCWFRISWWKEVEDICMAMTCKGYMCRLSTGSRDKYEPEAAFAANLLSVQYCTEVPYGPDIDPASSLNFRMNTAVSVYLVTKVAQIVTTSHRQIPPTTEMFSFASGHRRSPVPLTFTDEMMAPVPTERKINQSISYDRVLESGQIVRTITHHHFARHHTFEPLFNI